MSEYFNKKIEKLKKLYKKHRLHAIFSTPFIAIGSFNAINLLTDIANQNDMLGYLNAGVATAFGVLFGNALYCMRTNKKRISELESKLGV